MSNVIKGLEKLHEKFLDEGYSDIEALEEIIENGYTKEDMKKYGCYEWAEKTAKENEIDF